MLRARLFRFMFVLVAVVCAEAEVVAQSNQAEARTEAARIRFHGNVINFSSGEVIHISGSEKSLVRAGDDVRGGDTIQVKRGRAEILLNPGYYLRLGDNTEIELRDLAAANLKLKLMRGVAIVEISMDTWPVYPFYKEWKEHLFNLVTLITPRDELAIARAGAYRFDVASDGRTEITVLKGRLAIPGHMMKDETRASLFAGAIEATQLGKSAGDDFDAWSRERAKSLIQSNKSLKKRDWFKQMSEEAALLETSDAETAIPKGAARMLSALTGAVEFTEDGTSVQHADSAWQALKSGERLSNGDRVRTPPHTRAELRPYPDFYLFVDGDTELQYSETDGTVTVSLVKGSVILDAPKTRVEQRDRNDLVLKADNAEYHLTQSGYYRMSVPASGRCEFTLRFGSVKTSTQEIQAPKTVFTNGSSVEVQPFARATLDSFDVWSDHRTARYVNMALTLRRLRRIWFAAAWVFDDASKEFTLLGGGVTYKSPYGGEYSSVYNLDPIRRRSKASQ